MILKIEDDKKYLIMEAMMRLVKEFGLQGTPMSKLAKEAGVAAGTIYYYFNSKEELINSMYLDAKSQFGEAVKQINWSNKSYSSVMTQIGNTLFHFFCNNPDLFYFIEQCNRTPYVSQETMEEGKKYYKPFTEFLQRGINEEVFCDMDVNLLTSLMYGSLVTAVNLYLSGDPSISLETLPVVLNYVWKGIKLE